MGRIGKKDLTSSKKPHAWRYSKLNSLKNKLKMIATNKTHNIVCSHDFEESEFGIDQEDISFVIDLLRNQIYSNKPLGYILGIYN